MNYIVLTGHGNYATGIKSALELIAGSKDNVLAFDFLKEESEEQFSLKFKDLDRKNNYLFACDLMGGTPYKVYLFACDLMGGTPYKVVSRLDLNKEILIGTNLGGLLDIVFKIDKLSLNELAINLKEASLKSLVNIKDLEIKEKEVTDGI